MTLQQRIFRLNMLFLVLSLVTMLGVTLFTIEELSVERRERLSTGQRILSTEESLDAFVGINFSRLAQELYTKGISLHVTKEDDVIYSNLEEPEELQEGRISPSAHITRMGDEVLISRLYQVGHEEYHLYAVIDDIDHEEQEWEELLLRILTMGGLTILLLLGLNLFFTRRLLAAILEPLTQLGAAVERMMAGRYDQEIDYQGDEEFTKLTRGVNALQARLLANQEEKLLYEKNRTQMVAAISHDLRTPLTSIKGYSKGILDGIATNPDKQRYYLEVIYKKSQLMEELLDTLFTFSQLERAQLPLNLEKVDLSSFLSTYAEDKGLELMEQNVYFELSIEDYLPVFLDRLHFRRLLDNLLDNARKYAGVSPLTIQMAAKVKGDNIYWNFADNGQGVVPEKLPHLFDEFYRVDESRHFEGHGLGLAIVKQIIDSHGGQVWADSQRGLIFHFTLPLDKERV